MEKRTGSSAGLGQGCEGGRVKIRFATLVYGSFYTGMMVKYFLPSMMSANNIPAIAGKVDTEFWIYTTFEEMARTAKDCCERFSPVIFKGGFGDVSEENKDVDKLYTIIAEGRT